MPCSLDLLYKPPLAPVPGMGVVSLEPQEPLLPLQRSKSSFSGFGALEEPCTGLISNYYKRLIGSHKTYSRESLYSLARSAKKVFSKVKDPDSLTSDESQKVRAQAIQVVMLATKSIARELRRTLNLTQLRSLHDRTEEILSCLPLVPREKKILSLYVNRVEAPKYLLYALVEQDHASPSLLQNLQTDLKAVGKQVRHYDALLSKIKEADPDCDRIVCTAALFFKVQAGLRELIQNQSTVSFRVSPVREGLHSPSLSVEVSPSTIGALSPEGSPSWRQARRSLDW